MSLSAIAAEAISREAPASADGRETGGVLLGHDVGERLLVTVAGGPGPNADRRVDGFLRDLAHAQALGDEAYERDGSVWIGEWHTHPGGLTGLSSVDLSTYGGLLDDAELGFERLLSVIVTPCAFRGWAETHLVAWVVDPNGVRSVPIALAEPTHSVPEDAP